jgi:hypothetical protein
MRIPLYNELLLFGVSNTKGNVIKELENSNINLIGIGHINKSLNSLRKPLGRGHCSFIF